MIGRSASRTFATAILASAGLLAVACSGGRPLSPPTIHYGHDLCTYCNMIISDERFAAALVVEHRPDEPALFDDIACLLELSQGRPEQAQVIRWVHDFATGSWLDVSGAAFLVSRQLHTPMASGVAAFASLQDAEAARERLGGEVTTYAQLLSRGVPSRRPDLSGGTAPRSGE